MSSLNCCMFVGRVSAVYDPILNNDGVSIFSFGLAVDKYNSKKLEAEGKPTADFFTIKCFGKTASFLYEKTIEGVFSKGLMLCVEGRASLNKWEKDGEKKSSIEFIANNIQIIWPKRDQ